MIGDTIPRATAVAAAAAALVLLAACGGDDKSASTATTGTPRTTGAAQLTIVSPAEGASVRGNVVTLDLDGAGVAIVKADGDRSGASGHYHVFIDRDPVAPGAVIPKEAGVVHTTENPVVLSGLSIGNHRFVVVYGDGTHTRIGSAQAETTVTVEGPSVDATAPATVPAGQPVPVTVTVDGISLVKADGDTSGRTGHLHLFVDQDPTPAGQPIPVGQPGIIHTAETTIAVPDLAPGEHTIWVVVGDGAHMPLDPKVMDKLTVMVG